MVLPPLRPNYSRDSGNKYADKTPTPVPTIALTFLDQKSQVYAFQMFIIDGHLDLCILHQSAVEPESVVKEEMLQTRRYVA